MSAKRAIIAGLCLLSLALPPVAEAAGGFTFKKVGVKKPGSGKRINVQIKPEEDYYKNQHKKKLDAQADEKIKSDGDTAKATVKKAKPDLQDWFWKSNSGLITDAVDGRMHTAMQSLALNPKKARVYTPNISHYQGLAEKHGRDILLATLGKDLSPAFVLAVIGVESAGKTDAVSGAGAVGLMQLIPETAKRFKVEDSTDPTQNIKGGAAYLAWLLKEFDRDPLLALAGYNAGENAVKKHGGVPPYPETRAYVPKVVAAWQVARSLCMTPPKYVTDGCVFKTRAAKK